MPFLQSSGSITPWVSTISNIKRQVWVPLRWKASRTPFYRFDSSQFKFAKFGFPLPLIRMMESHWGRVTHICEGNLTIIGSDIGLSPERRQAIIWTNAGISLIGPLGTNFSEILIGIQTFSFTKMHLKMSSAKWRPFCLGLNVLTNSYVWREVSHRVIGKIVTWSDDYLSHGNKTYFSKLCIESS